MALADFHYTTGISSGFKVYILEGHSSFENQQRFHPLPPYRLPTCPIKRKASLDGRRIPEGQKASKARRLSCLPVAAPSYPPYLFDRHTKCRRWCNIRTRTTQSSLEQVAPPAAVPVAPIAVSCVSTSSAATCRDSRGLFPSCAQKRPPRAPLSEPAFTVAQLQQMRPSVITCAPRRSCPEAPPSPSSPLSPAKQKNNMTSNSPRSQRLCPWNTSISASFSRAASPKQTIKEADRNL